MFNLPHALSNFSDGSVEKSTVEQRPLLIRIATRLSKFVSIHRTACAVLLFSLFLTGGAFNLSYSFIQLNVQQRFGFQTQALSDAISKRLLEYEMVLLSGAGLMGAAGTVDRTQWQHFVSDLKLQQNYPGIQGLGFSQVIPPEQLGRHTREMQAQGFPTYSVKPEGARELYTSIIFLEPLDQKNQLAIGYDMFSESTRREAMIQARDTGQPTMSGRVTLVQDSAEGIQYGFLMYMPVYKRGMPDSTVQERRAAISGWVYSPFRANDFMNGILGDNPRHLALSLFDGDAATPQALLYQNMPGQPVEAMTGSHPHERSAWVTIPNNLRKWSLQVQTQAEYLSDVELYRPWRIAAGGIVLDLFLFYLLVSLGRQERELNKMSQQLKVKLEETELVLISAVETIGEAFVVYDPQDRLVFCNEEYRQFYATSAEVIQPGRTFEEIIRYGALRGQYPDAVGRVDEWVAERLAVHLRGDTELIQHLDDGRWLKIRERRTPSGHIAGFRVDVTELYQSKHAAEVANLAKSQFLATMSHEIRTPMNAMLGMAQVMLTPGLSENDRQDCARTILRAGQILLTLLNDALDISKVESGKFELQTSAFSPAALVAEMVQLFAAPVHLKNLTIRAEVLLDERQHYLADSTRMRQMLSNLIGNALKFTEQGEICVAVQLLEADAGLPLLEFSVSDSGIGIDKEKMGHLFEPFSQGDSSTSRQYGGSGLGLSIVRNFARWMGGDAGVSADMGVGSRFWFRIRAESIQGFVQMSKTSTVLLPPAKVGLSLPRFTGHALVAEDDLLQQKVVLAALTKLGLTTRLVGDGQQAVNLIMAGDVFDLILMDLSMPVLTGLEATALIRQWQKEKSLPLCPIVAITADAFDNDRRDCEEVGMDAFLAKPIDFRDLAKILEKWLPLHNPEASKNANTISLRKSDVDQLVVDLEEIIAMLAQRKFDAFGRFKALKKAFANTVITAELEEIEKGLDMMKFDQVIDNLRQLAQAQGRSLSA